MSSGDINLFSKWRNQFLTIGIILMGIAVVFAFKDQKQFFHAYLYGMMFWVGLSLGCLGLTLIYGLVGGGWAEGVKPMLVSGIKTLPVVALLFIPVLIGMKDIYIWTDHAYVDAHHAVHDKVAYLNAPFFIGRAVFYFLFWIVLSQVLVRRMKSVSEGGSQVLCGFGLLFHILFTTFAITDWMMSIEPKWFSTIYGALVMAGQVLSTFAMMIVLACWFMKHKLIKDLSVTQLHDLGKFMFAMTLFWAYLSISQLLIIWSANLPEEVPYYVHRLHTSWRTMSTVVLLFHFVIPFLILLIREVKRRPELLMKMALFMVFMRFVETYWLIFPDFHPNGFTFHVLNVLVPLGLGGIWMATFMNFQKGGAAHA